MAGNCPCVLSGRIYNPLIPLELATYLAASERQVRFHASQWGRRIATYAEEQAGVAQLVEHDVANVVVVGSNPITRSKRLRGWRLLGSKALGLGELDVAGSRPQASISDAQIGRFQTRTAFLDSGFRAPQVALAANLRTCLSPACPLEWVQPAGFRTL